MRKPEDIKELIDKDREALRKGGHPDQQCRAGLSTARSKKVSIDFYRSIMDLNVYGPVLANAGGQYPRCANRAGA